MATVEQRPRLSDYRLLEAALAEAHHKLAEMDAVRARNVVLERTVRERPTLAQARDLLDRNAHLEAVNDALVKRNTILVARERTEAGT